jgi:hypothetical protein
MRRKTCPCTASLLQTSMFFLEIEHYIDKHSIGIKPSNLRKVIPAVIKSTINSLQSLNYYDSQKLVRKPIQNI